MTEPVITRIKTSLAEQMAQPGGRTLTDVQRRADERLGRHRAEVMAEIEAAVAELESLCAARPQAAGCLAVRA